jgi:hypothetical protein
LDTTAYKDEIFSKRVRAGKRTYFFDVKATKSERDFYITITESKKVGETEFQKHKIFLYKEDFEKFADALAEAVDFVHDEFAKHPEALANVPDQTAAPVEEKVTEEVPETALA